LKAKFDANQQIELLEFVTEDHEEYLPRKRAVEAARPQHEWNKEWMKLNSAALDAKASPELNKKGKARPMKSPPTAPPDFSLPDSQVDSMCGVTRGVVRFLEV
jgi:hypothetical protein